MMIFFVALNAFLITLSKIGGEQEKDNGSGFSLASEKTLLRQKDFPAC